MHLFLHLVVLGGLLALVGCQECCTDFDCAEARSFCAEGRCVAGEAPEQPNDKCDKDVDCGDQICLAGSCAFAPECLRLDRSFAARLNQDQALGSVVATTSGCKVTFAYAFPSGLSSSATVERIERDGTFSAAVGLREGTGEFDPATRTGSFGVAVDDDIVFGTDTFICVDSADCAQQLFQTCGAHKNGVGVCQ